MKYKILVLFLVAVLYAPADRLSRAMPELSALSLLSSLVYGLIGAGLCGLGYAAFDRLAGLNLRRELVEDQNTAAGILMAGVFIGIAIVVTASIA